MSARRTPIRRARFITFEGIDGSGKSTQLSLLADELRRRDHDVVTTREPGGTPLGTRLRRALLDIDEQIDPLAELLLYAADRAQHVRTLIRPALDANKIVLSDRYADATLAYQGAGRALPAETIEQVIRLATDDLKPDLTLVFDLDITHARARLAARRAGNDRRGGDRLDNESAAFHRRVRDAYRRIADREPARVRLVDASSSIEEMHAEVMRLVLPLLASDG